MELPKLAEQAVAQIEPAVAQATETASNFVSRCASKPSSYKGRC